MMTPKDVADMKFMVLHLLGKNLEIPEMNDSGALKQTIQAIYPKYHAMYDNWCRTYDLWYSKSNEFLDAGNPHDAEKKAIVDGLSDKANKMKAELLGQ